MAAPRLSDAQKQELVLRFRDGAGTQELAATYGCSPNTVTRVVKAAIDPAQYEELKRQRSRRTGQSAPFALATASAQAAASETTCSGTPTAATEPSPAAPDHLSSQSELPLEPPAGGQESTDPPVSVQPIAPAAGAEVEAAKEPASQGPQGSGGDDLEAARSLAIDDADDFDDFDSEDDDDGEDPDDEELDDDGGIGFAEQTFVEVPISFAEGLDQPLTTPRPWSPDELPSSAYMLVDKTVELQARPLGEIPELGRLEATELELQALVLYSNPRQAKRHCGRTQRVIKVPDVGVLERTAPYLLRQGICRVVVEGALYALPEG